MQDRPVLLVGRARSTLAALGARLQESLGRRVEVTWRGSVALAVARERPPGAVLVDLGSLGSDAALLVARLRAEPSTAAVPIVALADPATRSVLRLAPPQGCDEVLESTVDPSVVAAALRRWLELGRAVPERVAR